MEIRNRNTINMKKLLIIIFAIVAIIPARANAPTCFFITDEKGKVITDAQVLVFEMKGAQGQIKEQKNFTVSSGIYCFNRDATRQYVLSIEKPGFEPVFSIYEPSADGNKKIILTKK